MAMPPEASMANNEAFAGHIPKADDEAVRFLEAIGMHDLPISVLVPARSSRRDTRLMRCRVWSRPPSPGSFWHVRDDVYCCSPEFVYLQMAGRLDLVGAVLLGYELCGRYSLSPAGGDGFSSRAVPLATRASLLEFVENAPAARGSKMARAALRFVREGSRSPMESVSSMLLGLPPHRGGKGCPTPLINHRVDLDDVARKVARRSYVECDFFWPRERIALEYDSNEFHASPAEMARDASKRAALETMGVCVFTLTWQQARDAEATDSLVRAMARKAGWRLRAPSARDANRERELRRRILPRAPHESSASA
jgi:hypothetical protein